MKLPKLAAVGAAASLVVALSATPAGATTLTFSAGPNMNPTEENNFTGSELVLYQLAYNGDKFTVNGAPSTVLGLNVDLTNIAPNGQGGFTYTGGGTNFFNLGDGEQSYLAETATLSFESLTITPTANGFAGSGTLLSTVNGGPPGSIFPVGQTVYLTFTLTNLHNFPNSDGTTYDANGVLTTTPPAPPVPEPTSLALALAGAVTALAGRVARRRS